MEKQTVFLVFDRNGGEFHGVYDSTDKANEYIKFQVADGEEEGLVLDDFYIMQETVY